MSIHVAGIIGLVVVFLIGTLRPINLGALALVMMFVHGTIYGQSVQDMYRGFPVDLFVLLAGVTYLFGVASNNSLAHTNESSAKRPDYSRRATWSLLAACRKEAKTTSQHDRICARPCRMPVDGSGSV